LQQLVEKLDHRNEEKITWPEFLTFMENEGDRREVVNDAQLYGIGVKRLLEGETYFLR
jgi:Ca2+-binding EF-hand superfamily protein